ncbi:MAG: sterol desaturase family protein [Candidatus Pacebacteria bacterium]|nr:sterol desaturase family protein [Candidatus Paceibacterota bacterium]
MFFLFVIVLKTFILGVIYASFFEWVLHKKIMHQVVGGFSYPFETHALVHHKVFKADDTYHTRDKKSRSKIPMAWWNGPVIIIVGMLLGPLPIAIWVYEFGYQTEAILLCTVSFLTFSCYFALYEYLHWRMHAPRDGWLEGTWVFKKLNAHHILHHRHMGSNFNTVVPLADWVLGTLLVRAKRPFMQVRGTSIPDVQP